MTETNALVLTSGGVDSSAALAFSLQQGWHADALFVDYGQPAAGAEGNASASICSHFGVNLRVITAAGLLIPSRGEINGRNLLLIAIAVAAAPATTQLLVIGLHAGSPYPDCSIGFAEATQSLLDTSSRSGVQLVTPFLRWKKPAVWDFANEAGVPLHLTYSCEAGVTDGCNSCASCKDRMVLDART